MDIGTAVSLFEIALGAGVLLFLALTGGVNIDTGGQAQDPSVNESRSNDQDHSLTTDLSMLAADLVIGLIASGQEKKSEEQDLAPNKKRGPRL